MKKDYYEREDGKILAYKKNRKPLLNLPTTKALQEFIGTVIRKSLQAEGPRYVKTQGYAIWGSLATRDALATGEYIVKEMKERKSIRSYGDSMWADIRSIKLEKVYSRPSHQKKLNKIPSGHQQIVTGIIKNIGDTPIRNILVKFELISRKTGRRSAVAVGMVKQRSDFQNFLRVRTKGSKPPKFLPESEEVKPLMPNESVEFVARTHNYVDFVWKDDKYIDMAIPMHESVSYEKLVRGGVGENGRWVKVGGYKYKTNGYFFSMMSKKIREYYSKKKQKALQERREFSVIRPLVKKLITKKLNELESENKFGNKKVTILKKKIKDIAMNNVKNSVVKLKDDERIYVYYTRGSS